MSDIYVPDSVYQLVQPLDEIIWPKAEPFEDNYLQVSDLHSIHYVQYGNPDGLPLVYLHGGPGGGYDEVIAQFFDPQKFRVILFDQRGAGSSKPIGELHDNTTWDLVEDIEKLRDHLNIDQWIVSGGSWGSTLAMVYSINHSERCVGFILRGVHLGTKEEAPNLWDLSAHFPEKHEEFANFLPLEERDDLRAAYTNRILSDDREVAFEAIEHLFKYNSYVNRLMASEITAAKVAEDMEHLYSFFRVCSHYFSHDLFLEDNYILNNVDVINHLPLYIVHGRYDVLCQPKYAYKLYKAWPGSELYFIPDAGHSGLEPGIMKALGEVSQKLYDRVKID